MGIVQSGIGGGARTRGQVSDHSGSGTRTRLASTMASRPQPSAPTKKCGVSFGKLRARGVLSAVAARFRRSRSALQRPPCPPVRLGEAVYHRNYHYYPRRTGARTHLGTLPSPEMAPISRELVSAVRPAGPLVSRRLTAAPGTAQHARRPEPLRSCAQPAAAAPPPHAGAGHGAATSFTRRIRRACDPGA